MILTSICKLADCAKVPLALKGNLALHHILVGAPLQLLDHTFLQPQYSQQVLRNTLLL